MILSKKPQEQVNTQSMDTDKSESHFESKKDVSADVLHETFYEEPKVIASPPKNDSKRVENIQI